MIVIKNIEFEVIEGDITKFTKLLDPFNFNRENSGKENLHPEIYSEIVKSRVFKRPDGEEIYIGCTKDVSDIIGIQYKEWDKLSRDNDKLRDLLNMCEAHNRYLNNELGKIKEEQIRKLIKNIAEEKEKFPSTIKEKGKHSFPLLFWEELKKP
jgi:hypothetical protein